MLPKSIVTELRLGAPKKMFYIQIETAFDKQSVPDVEINELGIVGDHQVQSFHGGADRAILQYDSNRYQALKAVFPNSSEYFVNGGYGENIVAAGMSESNMCIGDIVTVGSVVLDVTQHRPPCYKVNHRFNEPTMAVWSQNNASTGYMYRVLKNGKVSVGDIIEVVERPNPEWTVAKMMQYLYCDTNNIEATKALSKLDALGREVKTTFQNRLDNNTIEDWSGRLTGSVSEFEMRVVKVEVISDTIKRFYLQRNDLRPLPYFSAGASVALSLANGLTRTYSLCAPPADDTYQISVALAPKSRGGSQYMHASMKKGDTFSMKAPVNHFEMARDKLHIFVAAGIGITPFLVMMKEARANNETFELHYCVDDVNVYPFQDELTQYGCKVRLYSLEVPLSIPTLLDNHARGVHVYTCGSPGFVRLVRDSASHWSDSNIHFENFQVETTVDDKPFVVKIQETGEEIEIASGVSLLGALRNRGVNIQSSCEIGSCGQCRVKYNGEVDHKDTILSSSERATHMCACVSRAKGSALLEISIDQV